MGVVIQPTASPGPVPEKYADTRFAFGDGDGVATCVNCAPFHDSASASAVLGTPEVEVAVWPNAHTAPVAGSAAVLRKLSS